MTKSETCSACNPAAWEEVSLVCSGELAEVVAETFARFVPDGVVINSVTSFDQEAYEQRPTGEMQVVAYMPIDAELATTKAKLEEAIWYLSTICPLNSLSYRQIQNQDWMAEWKKHYQPLLLGKNLIVLPAWVDESVAGDRIPIRISPDMAFGTGTHPSTQLCMVALEKYGCKDENVIDIGSGSGILSIEAVRLGADRVLGVDIESDAVLSARRNAELNGMPASLIFEEGSLREILLRKDGLNKAPVVLANILAHILIAMFGQGLAETVSPQGILILGGILDHQAQSVLEAGEPKGLKLIETFKDGDWVVLVLRKEN
ncbi:MAG TPA: 50S ribosomal protein L11 methyltransferase [Anaerolineaceae bacterium]|nr:50S ribosomal protein L11 methyltransferase [Anaerolineaceae bacterium]